VSRSLVVDASLALKWVVTEPGSEEAASLLDEMTVGAVTLLAPEHSPRQMETCRADPNLT
jgi:hypothetical protein